MPDESYSTSDVQDYIEYIFQKQETLTDNPPIQIYINKMKNKTIFKIATGYTLELLTPGTIKLLGSTENKIAKDKNGENLNRLEVTEVMLVDYNIINNDYQQDSRVL